METYSGEVARLQVFTQKQRAELLSKYNRASINKPLWAERIVDIDKKIEVEETNIKNSLNNTISSKGAQSYINLIRYKENLRLLAFFPKSKSRGKLSTLRGGKLII